MMTNMKNHPVRVDPLYRSFDEHVLLFMGCGRIRAKEGEMPMGEA